MLRNIKLTITYDGTNFAGWQIQPSKRTIQGVLTEILERVLQEKVTLIGASRTDAGVHALGQVAHFHTTNPISCYKLLGALNGLLPPDIAVLDLQEGPQGFHARESAKRKTYRYLIFNAPIRHPLWVDRAWFIPTPPLLGVSGGVGGVSHPGKGLKLKEMQRGARHLVGRHDFQAFQGRKPATKTTVRAIYEITIRRGGPLWPPGGNHIGLPLQVEITGNGFLKQMVRNIVGLLVEVGEGKRPPGDVKEVLQSRDRKKAGACAPAGGLYLVRVQY